MIQKVIKAKYLGQIMSADGTTVADLRTTLHTPRSFERSKERLVKETKITSHARCIAHARAEAGRAVRRTRTRIARPFVYMYGLGGSAKEPSWRLIGIGK
eukprot:COSAG02_NODE_8126_length_2697_cov_7.124326_2_plen_99_part_01